MASVKVSLRLARDLSVISHIETNGGSYAFLKKMFLAAFLLQQLFTYIWLGKWDKYLVVEPAVVSWIPQYTSWKKTQPAIALGKLHILRASSEEGNGKPLQNAPSRKIWKWST